MGKFLLALFLIASVNLSSYGGTFRVTTADNRVITDRDRQGWYRDNGNHDTNNDNYVAINDTFRSFLSFDLSGVSDKILSAEVRIQRFTQSGPVDLFFHEVTTPYADINQNYVTGSAAGQQIFNDLGSGTQYGSYTVPIGNVDDFITFTLNSAAIEAINAARGGDFIIGMRSDAGLIFASSGGSGTSATNTPNELVLTTDDPNQPPNADAGPDITITDQDDNGSESVSMNGSGSTDGDGSIVEYEWRYSSNPYQFAYGVSPTITLPIGDNSLRLKVTDDDGSTDIDYITVTVDPYTHTVTFVLDDKGIRVGGGGLNQQIETNSSAAAPIISGNAGWIFEGWDVAFDNITSNLTVTAQYSVDLDNTQPDQDVEITEERTGGSSSDLTSTFEANSLSLGDGADFNLGPNEILDLNGGDLVIEEGAVFSGNGTILGNIINSGLLRIPVVKVGMVLPQITNEGFVEIERPKAKTPAKVEAPIDNGGTFSTDASLEVTGTFTQTSTGTLRLFAEGEEAGVSYSQLIVGDMVTLDGEIQLVLDQAEYGLFTLNPGDTFDVVVINPDVTGKVITLQAGLGYRILATAAIQSQADIAALSPTAYVPTQANDPDVLVELPSGLFTFTLVENDTVLRATYQGSTPLPAPTTGDIEITSLIPSIDTDPASDTWETANGFDPAVNDMLTRDSDGDGDPDIRELFQGTGKNSGGEQFGFKGTQGNPATQTLSTQFRRSTESTVMNEIEGVNQWSTDLVNWYESGESNGNVVVTFSEQPTDMGTYEIVDVDVTVTNGQTPKLYYRLDLRAKE